MTWSGNELEPLPLPEPETLASLGIRLDIELHTGHQSRVFRIDLEGDPHVLKLSDGRFVDDAFAARLAAVATLATSSTSVVGPISHRGVLTHRLGRWRGAIYPLVSGREPDIASEADVADIAAALSSLHTSMAQLPRLPIPSLRALPRASRDSSRDQLLHGDYSHTNVLIDETELHVLDFDDCGYGPVEFEIGNTLFMVLFDAVMSSTLDQYHQFRHWFVDAYAEASGKTLDEAMVDVSVATRRSALAGWVQDPTSAPVGIRTAPAEWLDRLRWFLLETDRSS